MWWYGDQCITGADNGTYTAGGSADTNIATQDKARLNLKIDKNNATDLHTLHCVRPNISWRNWVSGDVTLNLNGCSIHCQIEKTEEWHGGVLWTWSTASQTETQKSQIISSDENLTEWRAIVDIIMKSPETAKMWQWQTTRYACGKMKSVYVVSHVYRGSFLPRTIRDTGNTD